VLETLSASPPLETAVLDDHVSLWVIRRRNFLFLDLDLFAAVLFVLLAREESAVSIWREWLML
jgi:hypothetical protein